jgi:hypothetical protein
MANIHKRIICFPTFPAGIVLSDLGLAVVVYGLYKAGLTLGWAWLVKSYVVPYLIVNFWLVTITFLQHTHPNLPHYEDEEWDWLRGALATVDRRCAVRVSQIPPARDSRALSGGARVHSRPAL